MKAMLFRVKNNGLNARMISSTQQKCYTDCSLFMALAHLENLRPCLKSNAASDLLFVLS